MKPLFVLHRVTRRVATLLALAFATLSSPGSAQAPAARVAARVVDAVTGRPVTAAAVSAGRAFTLTATDGTFTLAVPETTSEVSVERLGYASVSFPAGSVPREIRLDVAPYLLERLAVAVDRGQILAAGSALAADALERTDLDLMAGTSVAELLSAVEGVQTSRVGSWGSRAVIRGLTGERISVLIDGNRVNRACTFGMDQGLASVDPSQVERVEVLSGPGSALYGSGNVGGIINVVTRRPDGTSGLSGEFRAGASSAVPGGTLGGNLHVGSRRLGATLSLDASRYGDYQTPTATVDGSSYRQVTGDAKVDFRPADAHLVSFKSQYYAGRDIGWPMMTGASIPEEDRTSFSVDYGWQMGRGTLDGLSIRAFRQKLDHHMVVDAIMQGAMGPMTAKADATSYSTTSGARAQLRLAPSAGLHADVGGEVTRWFAEATRWTESGSGNLPPKENTFHIWPAVRITDAGAFLQAEAGPTRTFKLSVGGRLDHVTRDADDRASSSETVATGNVGLRADLGGGFGLRTSMGMGYRNPDPMELYGLALKPDGFVYRGSPDLETERSRSVEAALSWTGDASSLSVTAYRNHLKDMTSLVLVPGETVVGRPVREYTTLGSATLKGVTASAQAELAWGLGVRLGGSYTRAEDEATGAPLVGIAPAGLDAALRRTFDGRVLRWVEVAAEGSDAQDRIAESAGETRTPGYGVTHVRTGLELGGARLTAGVENIFDRQYRGHLDPVKLFRPGRNLFMRVSRSF